MEVAAAAGIAPRLLAWWRAHGRKDLPWQQDPSPYRVWVSEIMLQQTQVATVVPYYQRFLESFPDVRSLAAASQDSVLHHWSGLGYYARARNLHRAARRVVAEHGGRMPEDFDALLALPGIGRSTAGAILALSRGRRFAILDGNAKRVLARYFGVEGWPGRSAVARELWRLAEACTPGSNVAQYTQAIMDLGAGICRRGRPDCTACPLSADCSARASGRQLEIPARAPRRHRPRRAVHALMVARADGAVLLERRPSEGLWGGLWGLPEAEDLDGVLAWCERHTGCRPGSVEHRAPVMHAFTHFDLDIHPVLVRIAEPDTRLMEAGNSLWYKLDGSAEVGLSAPVARLLASLGETS